MVLYFLPNSVQILKAFSDLVPAYFKAFSSFLPLQGSAMLGKLSCFPSLDTLPLWLNVVSQSNLPSHFCLYKYLFKEKPALMFFLSCCLPWSLQLGLSLLQTSQAHFLVFLSWQPVVCFIFLLYFRNHKFLRSDFIHSTNPRPGGHLGTGDRNGLSLWNNLVF